MSDTSCEYLRNQIRAQQDLVRRSNGQTQKARTLAELETELADKCRVCTTQGAACPEGRRAS